MYICVFHLSIKIIKNVYNNLIPIKDSPTKSPKKPIVQLYPEPTMAI